MSNCRHSRDRLGRYFDGELPSYERRTVEDHLQQCSRCSTNLKEIREISGVFAEGITIPPVPQDLTQTIMRKAQAQIKGTLPGWSFLLFWGNWSLPMRLAAMVVAAAACYIGIAIGSASLPSSRRAANEMQWIDMSSRGPIVTAYVGSAR
jgi:anti-sigma factor RsiW